MVPESPKMWLFRERTKEVLLAGNEMTCDTTRDAPRILLPLSFVDYLWLSLPMVLEIGDNCPGEASFPVIYPASRETAARETRK